jgi:hypothetical protein
MSSCRQCLSGTRTKPGLRRTSPSSVLPSEAGSTSPVGVAWHFSPLLVPQRRSLLIAQERCSREAAQGLGRLCGAECGGAQLPPNESPAALRAAAAAAVAVAAAAAVASR